MSFLYDLADINYKTSVFYASGSWIKPQGITMISITAIGAGGGGAAGTAAANTVARTGGGGGGSGAITRLMIPEMFITDSLIINVGTGGSGGLSSAGAGTNGGPTTVDMPVPGNGDIYTRVITASGGTGGGAGATAGAAGVVANVSEALYSTIGEWTAVAGQLAGAGTTATGTSITYAATVGVPITSGAGGGGMAANGLTATNGGAITGAGFVPTNPGGISGAAGNRGVYSLTPFYSLGGSGGGGGGNTPVSGGAGGHGNPGCGGGGGGGGTTPTGAGGTGGKGGDGLVIIQCW